MNEAYVRFFDGQAAAAAPEPSPRGVTARLYTVVWLTVRK